MEEPGFWDDPERSTRLMKEAKNLKDTVEGFQKLQRQYEDIELLIEMGYEDNDPEVIPEIRQMLDEHYPKGFPLRRYKGFAGVMQQYAFYYELVKQ